MRPDPHAKMPCPFCRPFLPPFRSILFFFSFPFFCSYGRGKERGAARPEVLQSLLASTSRVVQQIDSVEYGLTDIQEYVRRC